MDLLQLLLLGIVQGLTEFLPISSSAHLILLPQILHWPDQGLGNDIAAHIGTLAAVLIYLRRDLKVITVAGLEGVIHGRRDYESRMFWYLVIASIPVVAGGYLLYDIVSTAFRNPLLIAGTNLVFGALLWWADHRSKGLRRMDALRMKDVLILGLAQLLSIMPGTSRSGVTMTAGLWLGLDRRSSARFSFLMSIPVTLMAGSYEAYRYFIEQMVIDWTATWVIVISSGLTAWLTIYLFLGFLERTGMLPYVIYRFLLGILLIATFI